MVRKIWREPGREANKKSFLVFHGKLKQVPPCCFE